MSHLPSFEEPYAPEDGVNSFVLLAVSMGIPNHSSSLVSDTLNGSFAYLRLICLVAPVNVDSAPDPDSSVTAPIVTKSEDYLLALPGLNLHRSQFALQQQQDHWCKLVFKVLSSKGGKVKFPRCSTETFAVGAAFLQTCSHH